MKRRIFVILLALSIFFCSVFAFCAYKKSEQIFTPEKWDSHIWKREKMIDSLTQQYNLYRMNYNEVIELLGTNGLVESRTKKNSCLTYYIGKGIGDPLLFTIRFNEDKVVIEYVIANG